MKTINHKPAYPQPRDFEGRTPEKFGVGGMTIRDYFAGQVISGLIQTPHDYGNKDQIQSCAIGAYIIADAMMEARARGC